MFKKQIEVDIAVDVKKVIDKYRAKDIELSMIFGVIDRHRSYVEMMEFLEHSKKIHEQAKETSKKPVAKKNGKS